MLTVASNIPYLENCESIIFFPPIPSLGGFNPDTQIQKIILTAEKRKEIREFFANHNFSTDLKSYPINNKSLSDFYNKVKKTENVNWAVFDFHGAPRFATTKEVRKDRNSFMRTKNTYLKKEFDYGDLLLLSGGDLTVIDFYKSKFKKGNTSGKWINPCQESFEEYSRFKESAFKLNNSNPLDKEEKLLIEDYKKATTKGCEFFKRSIDLMSKHFTGPRPEEVCRIQEAYFRVQNDINKCLLRNFNENLLDSGLISTIKGGSTLIQSCAVGLEQESYTGEDSLSILNGCPQELKRAKELLRTERKSNSQKTATQLCSNAKEGANFTISTDTTFGSSENTFLGKELKIYDQKVEVDPEEDDLFVLDGAKAIYTELKKQCQPEVEEMKEKLKSLKNDLDAQLEDENTNTNQKLDHYRQLLSKLSCDNNTNLDSSEQQELKDTLEAAHVELLLTLAGYFAGFKESSPFYIDDIQDIALTKKIMSFVEVSITLYERADFSTHDKQVKGIKRLIYLMEQDKKAFGYYDCYKCDGKGNAEKITCNGIKDKFEAYSFIQERSDYDKRPTVESINQLINQIALSAENGPVPFCSKALPPCTFGDCNTNSKKHTK